ncbi:hypothetical protein EYF80_052924 [Liparis tanakae]|uniref:Uncharacterized protein n=1 Tax=Liparis tanakae TaxID=230148 RepID=A0A4Z2F7X5_9TELE|nr:hypothetical protein EYF80_052924 [Liparis tanakae]
MEEKLVDLEKIHISLSPDITDEEMLTLPLLEEDSLGHGCHRVGRPASEGGVVYGFQLQSTLNTTVEMLSSTSVEVGGAYGVMDVEGSPIDQKTPFPPKIYKDRYFPVGLKPQVRRLLSDVLAAAAEQETDCFVFFMTKLSSVTQCVNLFCSCGNFE